MMGFVSWGYDIPNIWKNQTCSYMVGYPLYISSYICWLTTNQISVTPCNTQQFHRSWSQPNLDPRQHRLAKHRERFVQLCLVVNQFNQNPSLSTNPESLWQSQKHASFESKLPRLSMCVFPWANFHGLFLVLHACRVALHKALARFLGRPAKNMQLARNPPVFHRWFRGDHVFV